MLYTVDSMVRVCEIFKDKAIVTNVNFDRELALGILKGFSCRGCRV